MISPDLEQLLTLQGWKNEVYESICFDLTFLKLCTFLMTLNPIEKSIQM